MNSIWLITRHLIWTIAIVWCFSNSSFAFENIEVHPKINEVAAEQSILVSEPDNYLTKQLGLSNALEAFFNKKTIKDLIKEGDTEEDANPRPLRHFHDPLKSWDSAGIWNLNLSALLWAQSNPDSSNIVTWQAARTHFYDALTLISQEEREKNFAETFKSLGQLMHLVSDMAVPAHVRDDGHPEVMLPEWVGITHFEIYTKNKVNDTTIMKYEAASKPSPELFNQAKPHVYASSPVSALFDIDKYDETNPEITRDDTLPVGLAEYTNANFLSEGAMFWSYSYPDESETNWGDVSSLAPEQVLAEDNKLDTVRYVVRNSDNNEKIAALSYWYVDGSDNGPVATNKIILDDEVYKSYAGKLVPKAVGYSSALLDYFFRGKMDARNAFFIKDNLGNITGLNIEIKNSSKLGEAEELFVNGTVELAYQYTLSDVSFAEVKNIYTIYDEFDAINTDYISIALTFSNPIPIGVKDLSFTLIYKGILGNEPDAVAARVLPLTSEIAYAYQPDGLGTQSDIYTILPDGTNKVQVTDEQTPNTWLFSPAFSSDQQYLGFIRQTCSNPDHQTEGWCEGPHGGYIDILDRTLSLPYPSNMAQTLAFVDDVNWADTSAHHLQTFFFSPNGDRICAVASDGYYTGLVIYDLSAGTYAYIDSWAYWLSRNLYGSKPEWSPDGSYIAYTQLDDIAPGSPADIFIITPDGTTDIQLTSDGYRNIQPSWSPDGEELVFSSNRQGEGILDIWIMEKNGTIKRRIYNGGSNCYSPSFSPDGQSISFEQGGDVYTISIDSSNT